MPLLGRLYDAVAEVCPIDGVSVGKVDDKKTWRIDFLPQATDVQKTAAAAVVKAFDPSVPEVPDSVHMWQAKAALAELGKLDAADAAVKASGNQTIIIAWEYAPEISRKSAAVNAIGSAVGLKPADLDALFISAAAIAV